MYNNTDVHPLNRSILSLSPKSYDAIFKYLSLKDLHSLGQTCKAMQIIAGQYFQKNIPHDPVYLNSDGIYVFDQSSQYKQTKISGFTEFIDKIVVFFGFSLDFMKLHLTDFKSLKKIEFKYYQLTKDVAACMEPILPQIEVISMFYSTVIGDFYDIFLKYCPNIKKILFTDCFRNEDQTLRPDGSCWLQQKYTLLEEFSLLTHASLQVSELGTFLREIPAFDCFQLHNKCFGQINTNFCIPI